jgi:AcrR family transcriptional regulator
LPRWENSRNTNEDVYRVKRQAVLKEAAHAFGRRGYHNTSLDDVARALQISKGTLYNYIRDKQEILFECHKQALDIGDAAVAEVEIAGECGANQLARTMTIYVTHLIEELGACAALMEVDALREEDRTAAIERRNGFQDKFIAIVERGIADGSIKQVDPMIVMVTFMGAVNWIPRWYSPVGRSTPAEVAKQMVEVLVSGIRT